LGYTGLFNQGVVCAGLTVSIYCHPMIKW